jgi:tripartite-type tricarboxylate transporter receptor subunit TctC
MKQRFVSFMVLGIALAVLAFSVSPTSAAGSYEGKTIRIIVAASPGGGFDTHTRTMARFLPKHLPGNPTVIVQNMPGASGLIAANYLYSKAKPGGETFGLLSASAVLGQLYGGKGIKFDARKFQWLGVPGPYHLVCAFSKASGVTDLDKWATSKKPVKLGATGLGALDYDAPQILRTTLSLPTHLVRGYGGTARSRLAVESGEISGVCFSWDAMKTSWGAKLDSGDVVPVVQAAPKAADLPKVPAAIDLAKSQDARKLITLGIHHASVVNRAYTLPPGTPKEKVRVMRKAYLDTLRDPEFLAAAKKAKLAIDPVSGERLAEIVDELLNADPQLLAKLKQALNREN